MIFRTLLQRLRTSLRRLRTTPDFAEEGWVRDWQAKRLLRLEHADPRFVEAAGSAFEAVDAPSTLPRPDTDALDEPAGAERAVCNEEPRGALFVRRDGAVFPCSVLAQREGFAPWGHLPEDDAETIWEGADARRFRKLFAERCRVRDDRFFQRTGGTRTLYDRSIREAGRDLPEPPDECGDCPRLRA